MSNDLKNSKGIWVFILFWSGVTLLFDGMIIVGMVNQMQAVDFPTTQGTITKSEIEVTTDEDGTTYSVDVTYTFQVDGKTHQGDRYRYNDMGSNDGRAQEIVKGLPVGKKVTVHYNPEDPSDAVLQVAVEGMDLFLLMFLTPFNVIMVGMTWVGIQGLFSKNEPADVIERLVKQDGSRSTIRLPHVRPLLVAGGTLLGVCFISIFIIAFGFGLTVSLDVMVSWWTGILGFVGFIYIWRLIGELRGRYTVVIDLPNQRIELPGRQLISRRRVPFRDITRVEVVKRKPSYNDAESAIRYEPTLYVSTDMKGEQAIGLGKLKEKGDADRVVDWLREQVD